MALQLLTQHINNWIIIIIIIIIIINVFSSSACL
jgi:hypothetical protein